MARRQMRRRTKRPLDWVVQPATYDGQPFTLPGGGGEQLLSTPLTYHPDIDSSPPDQLASRTPQLEQTAIRVKGQIFYVMQEDWWNLTAPNRTWPVSFRIAKTVQEASGRAGLFTTLYDLTGAVAANDDFLWEVKRMHRASSFLTNFADPSDVVFQHDVDVRVKRRLRQRDILALIMSVGNAIGDAGELTIHPQVRVWTFLRTLIQTNT